MPDIFELFERLEAEYRHVPKLPIVYGDLEEDTERTERRVKEAALQEALQAGRVRQVDDAGVARGLGKRKTAVAHVRLWERSAASAAEGGLPEQVINGRPFAEYFANLKHRKNVLEPFAVSGSTGEPAWSTTRNMLD